MPRFRPMLVAVLVLAVAGCTHVAHLPPASPRTTWPHEVSDLKPDPAVVWGRLENGLRYAILPHAVPRDRVSVFLHVHVGSLHENNRERGFAHFVEHMAFRELCGFTDGAFPTLTRLGAGPHANATTGLFETTYYFPNLPVNEPAALATGLQLLRAMADGIVFNEESVAQERGVIASEARSHEGRLARSRADELDFLPPRATSLQWQEIDVLLKNTRAADRHPLGDEKTILRASPAKLRAFYERWYRPERMVLVVVGDISAAALEPQLRETFSSLTAHGRSPREPALASPKNPGRLLVVARPAESSLHFSLGVTRAHDAHDDTAARQRSLTRRLALDMLRRRLERAADKADAPFFSVEAFSSHYVPARELVVVRGSSRPGDWPRAVSAFDFEVRRANELGFDPAELAHAVKRELVRASINARQAIHRPSAELASALAHAAARGVVFTSEADDRQRLVSQLAAIDPAQCHAAFRAMLLSDEWSLALLGPFDTSQSVSVNYRESRTAELKPYDPPPPPQPFPFTDFGPPGEVVKNEHSATLDAELVQFANGVRLTVKRTRFEPGNVRMEARIVGGRLACPPDKPGLEWRSIAWLYGGIEGLSFEEQSSALSELSSVHYSVAEGVSAFSTETDPANLLLLLQAGAAQFKYPAFRREGAARALEFTRQVMAPYTSTASGVANIELLYRLSGQHPAFRTSTLEETSQRTLDELKAWFIPHLASAPLDITIVGDIDPAIAIDACARTFGALPSRSSADPFVEHRQVPFPRPPFSETVRFKGSDAVAVVALAWPAPSSSPDHAGVQILAKILQNRVFEKLRSEMGETYSPSVTFYCNETFSPAIAILASMIEADPSRVDHVAAAAREIAAQLAREGASHDEFERARQPLRRNTEAELSDNGWWIDTLAAAQVHPHLSEARIRLGAEYEATTLAEVNALARELLAPDRVSQLIAAPQ